MAEYYTDDDGNVMVREPAGGHGGGVTSYAVRRATDDEAAMWRDYVAATEAAQASLAEPEAAPEVAAEPEADPIPPRAEA